MPINLVSNVLTYSIMEYELIRILLIYKSYKKIDLHTI